MTRDTKWESVKNTRKQESQEVCPSPTAIGTVSVNSVESDLGFTSRVYFDNVTLALQNATLTSQKPYQNSNKCNCSNTNAYK